MHLAASSLTNTKTIFACDVTTEAEVASRIASMRAYAQLHNKRLCITIQYETGIVRSVRV